MNHIYAKPNPELAQQRRKEIIADNIRFLRSFEMKYGQSQLITERIQSKEEELNNIDPQWLGKSPSVNTSLQ